MKLPYDLANDSQQAFMKAFGNLYEHSSWVAEKAYIGVKQSNSYNDLEHFHVLLCETMLASKSDLHDALICSHPVLAGKKVQTNELTHFSDRKSTRLNSSHVVISYAVFCLKKKKK